MAKPPQRDDCPAPTPLGNCSSENPLARSLINVANTMRSIYEGFGLRPYRVMLVKTQWSGGRRGVGIEELASEKEIRPTPLVGDLKSLTDEIMPIGANEVGSIVVSEINGNFTENELRGIDADGCPIAPEENFYYEIEFLQPGQTPQSDRRRFSLRGAPNYVADQFQWTIRLDRQYSDRTPMGAISGP